MITVEAALGDLDKNLQQYKDKDIDATETMVLTAKVLLKFLSTMRSNQLLTEERKTEIYTESKNRKEKSKS